MFDILRIYPLTDQAERTGQTRRPLRLRPCPSVADCLVFTCPGVPVKAQLCGKMRPFFELTMAKRSNYQQRIIRDYYKNRDAIALQKLSELVSELYLAEGKARARCWDRIAAAMKNLDLKDNRIEHLRDKDNPALVAKLVEELMAKE